MFISHEISIVCSGLIESVRGCKMRANHSGKYARFKISSISQYPKTMKNSYILASICVTCGYFSYNWRYFSEVYRTRQKLYLSCLFKRRTSVLTQLEIYNQLFSIQFASDNGIWVLLEKQNEHIWSHCNQNIWCKYLSLSTNRMRTEITYFSWLVFNCSVFYCKCSVKFSSNVQ